MKLNPSLFLSVLFAIGSSVAPSAFAAPAVATHCEAVGPNAAKAWLSGFDLLVRTNGEVATLRNMRVNPQGAYGSELGSILLPTQVSPRNANYRPKSGSRFQGYSQYKAFPISTTQWIFGMEIRVPADYPSPAPIYAVWVSRDGIFTTDAYDCR